MTQIILWMRSCDQSLVNSSIFIREVIITSIWDGIKNEIKKINGGECNSVEKGEYNRDFMNFKFNTGNNFPLIKPLKLHLLTISYHF